MRAKLSDTEPQRPIGSRDTLIAGYYVTEEVFHSFRHTFINAFEAEWC